MSASPRPADRTKLGRPPRGPSGLQDRLCLGDPRSSPRPPLPRAPGSPAGQRPTRGVRGGSSVCSLGCLGSRSPTPTPRGRGGGRSRPGDPAERQRASRRAGGLASPAARGPRRLSPPALAGRRVHRDVTGGTTKGRSPPGRSCRRHHHHPSRSSPRQEVLFSSRPSLLVPIPCESTSIASFPPLHLGAPGSVGPGRVGSCCSPVAARRRRPENSFQPHLSVSLLGRTSLLRLPVRSLVISSMALCLLPSSSRCPG